MIFAANWKMNKTPDEAKSTLAELAVGMAGQSQAKVVIFPSPVLSAVVAESCARLGLKWGGQNAHWQVEGAFTGETSPRTLKLMGASHCLLGHSERRHFFHESNEMLAKKVPVLQKEGLTPVLCLGETLAEREAGKTEAVLEEQLRLGLEYANFQASIWLAYEPVWAIGTGKVASVAVVTEAHRFIRQWLVKLNPALSRTPILYGGSVKPDNVRELAMIDNVDGFLVGGASLKAADFLALIRAVAD